MGGKGGQQPQQGIHGLKLHTVRGLVHVPQAVGQLHELRHGRIELIGPREVLFNGLDGGVDTTADLLVDGRMVGGSGLGCGGTALEPSTPLLESCHQPPEPL